MLSVVVPTFNEGKNIRNLVTQIDEALKGIDYEILFDRGWLRVRHIADNYGGCKRFPGCENGTQNR